MAKVSITELAKPSTPSYEDESTKVLVESPKSQVAKPFHSPLAEVEGEWDERDIQYPRINLVAKTGPLSDKFQSGSFVLNGEHVFSDGKTPFTMIVARLEKLFIEDVGFLGDVKPRTFYKREDVRANAGTTDYNEHKANPEIPYFRSACRVVAVIESEKEGTFFPIQLGDKWYTIASWLMAKSAFSSAGQKIFNDSQFYLRKGLLTGSYKVTSEIQTNDKGSWYVPKLVNGGKTTEEFQAGIKAILG